MSFWEKVKKGLRQGAREGWDLMKDKARIGRLRYRKFFLHRKAERRFADIGGIVYDMAKPPYENPLSRPEVLKLVDEIRKIEERTAELDAEIEAVRRSRKERAGQVFKGANSGRRQGGFQGF